MKNFSEQKQQFDALAERSTVVDPDGKEYKERHETWVARLTAEFYDLLCQDGTFYTVNDAVYYFSRLTRELYLVADGPTKLSDFEQYLALVYAYSVAWGVHAKVYPYLYARARYEALESDLHSFSYYDVVNGVCYIRASNSDVLRIDDSAVSYVSNGTDGVIFKRNSWMDNITVDVNNILDDPRMLQDKVFSRIWFDPLTTLGADRQRVLLRQWFHSMFFPQVVKRKPLVVMQGPTGTGKTSTLANIGRLLFGQNFSETMMPTDQRDMINLLANNHFIVLDNVDDKPPEWFLDTITAVTTGAMMSYRPLYQDPTAEPLRVKANCYIAITTRSGDFNRPDVANRSLVMQLAKNESTAYDPKTYEDELLASRQALWSYLLSDIQKITRNLHQVPEAPTGVLRMAEFTNFILRANPDSEQQSYNIKSFELLATSQMEFGMQNKPVIDTIVAIANDMHVPRQVSPTELLNLANGPEYQLNISNILWLGRYLRESEETLKQVITFERRKNAKGTDYYIGPKAAPQPTLL